jgi:hypothetical protein
VQESEIALDLWECILDELLERELCSIVERNGWLRHLVTHLSDQS